MNRYRKLISTLAMVLVISAIILAGIPRKVQALPIDVNTPNDELDGLNVNGACSLREAIENANNDDKGQDDCRSGADTNVIILDDWLFTLTLDGARLEDLNQTGDLDITGELTIIGAGTADTIIQAGTSSPLNGDCGNCIDRVFHILASADVTLRDLTVRYGQAPMGTETLSPESGGGIKNQGELTLNSTAVTYNHAGDAWDSDSGGGGFGGNGGGIQNMGSLTAINSWITHNHAGTGGDGFAGGYGGFGGYGGGILSGFEDTILLTNTVVRQNKAGNGGRGGDKTDGNGGFGGDGGRGGGIYCGGCQLTMLYSSLLLNDSGMGGNGGDAFGSSGNGGTGGYGGKGAGVYLDGTDTSATVGGSRIHSNLAGTGGYWGMNSSITAVTQSHRGSGGGFYVEDEAQLNITGSTISDNHGYHGGGISNNSWGLVTLYNSTVSGNWADYDGGGLHVADTASTEVTFVTITDNIADYDWNTGGTGGGFSSLGTFTMTNSIIADNHDYSGSNNIDCRGIPISMDYNLLGVADSPSCIDTPLAHDQWGTIASPLDPLLFGLGNNGGPTQTHALHPISVAVNWIDPGVNGCNPGSTKDQRGMYRVGYCDIGAYEISHSVYLPMVMK